MVAEPVRVLVIDDDRVVRQLLRMHLEVQDGFTCVDVAEDAATGVALAELVQPDVIVLDAMMPGRSGIDAVADLVAAAPGSGVVVYSAVVEPDAIGRLSRIGVSAIVPKSDGLDALQDAIRTVSTRRPPRAGAA